MMSKTLNGLLAIAVMGLALVSCVKTDDEVADTSSLWYHAMASSTSLVGDEAETTFPIVADCDWQVTSEDDWLDIEPRSGRGTAMLRLVTGVNPSSVQERTAHFMVRTADGVAKRVSLTQGPSTAVTPPPAPLPPVVGNSVVLDVDEIEALLSSSVVESESAVTDYGFCYGTDPDPSVTGQRHSVPGALTIGQPFTATLTGLAKNQHYYVCAYATSEAGTTYGTVAEFTTLSIPKEGDLDKPRY